MEASAPSPTALAPVAPPAPGLRASPAATAVTVSLVIPAWREAARLPASLREIARFLASAPWSAEVIVVDDGSDDGTSEVARAGFELLDRFVLVRHAGNRGKGAAVRTGFERARGEYLFFSDADLSTPLTELPALLAHLRGGADVVVGSRHLPDSDIRIRQPLHRRVAGAAFRALAGALVPVDLRDALCGLKGFRREVGLDLVRRSRVDGYVFDVEWAGLARRCGRRLVEVPVRWSHRSDSTVSVSRALPVALRDLWSIRRRLRREPRSPR